MTSLARLFLLGTLLVTFSILLVSNPHDVSAARKRHRARAEKKSKSKKDETPVTISLISFPNIPQRFIEARVNESSKRLFLVDTAASQITIFDWYADELKLPPLLGESPQKPADSNPVHQVKLASLSVGSIEQKDIAAAVVTSPAIFKKLQVAGILSPQNFLAEKTFTIDFKQNLIILESKLKKPDRTTTTLVDCGGQKKFALTTEIKGKKALMNITTGVSNSVVYSQFADDAGFSRKISLDVNPKNNLEPEEVTIGGKSFGKVSFDVEKDDPGFCNSKGHLGMAFLEGLRLTFSSDRKTLIIEK